MNRKSVSLAIALVLLTIASTTFFAPVSAENITILSSIGWIDSTGHYRLAGEVQNTGSNTARYVRLSITFYDSNNKMLETFLTEPKLVAMQPNAKSPFNAVGVGLDSNYIPYDAHKVDHYDIQIHSVNWLPAQEGLQILPDGLKILSSGSYTDSTGHLHIDGEIQNTGTLSSNNTMIFVTLYDSGGRVVDVMQDNSYPESISSGSVATFAMTYHAYFYPSPPSVASYSLTAESSDYGLNSTNLQQSLIPIQTLPSPSIPEFPSRPILPFLMAATVFGAILISRRKACR